MPMRPVVLHRRADAAGEPVDHHVREELVPAEAPLDVAAAVAPRAPLLHDPGREPDGRVGEAVRERARARRLDRGVAALGRLPACRLVEPGLLLGGALGGGRGNAERQRKVDAATCAGWRCPSPVATNAPRSLPWTPKRRWRSTSTMRSRSTS